MKSIYINTLGFCRRLREAACRGPQPSLEPFWCTVEPARLDVDPPGIDIGAPRLDIDPERLVIDPKRPDFGPRKVDIDSKRLDIEPRRVDIDSKRLDIQPREGRLRPEKPRRRAGMPGRPRPEARLRLPALAALLAGVPGAEGCPRASGHSPVAAVSRYRRPRRWR